MKYVFLCILIVVVVLAQASFFPPLGIQPNLLLIVVLSILFLGFANESYYAAFLGGLLLDLLSSGIFGISSLLMLLIVWVVWMIKKVVGEGFMLLIPVTFAAAVVFRRGDFKGAVLDAVLLLILFPILKWILPKVFADRELKVG